MTREEAIKWFEKRIEAERLLQEEVRKYGRLDDTRACEQDIEACNMAIEALKEPNRTNGEWIPLKTRPMDDDERKEWSEKYGYQLEDDEAVIYTSQLPDVGQEVLICLKSGDIRIDSFEDDADGCYFYEFDDMENVVAWMPLPKPYERR